MLIPVSTHQIILPHDREFKLGEFVNNSGTKIFCGLLYSGEPFIFRQHYEDRVVEYKTSRSPSDFILTEPNLEVVCTIDQPNVVAVFCLY